MITVYSSRSSFNSPQDVYHYPERQLELVAAVRSLVKFELGFGGIIKEIDDNRIKVVTHVLGKIDTTIFTGDREEMKPLVTAVLVYLKSIENYGQDRIVDDVINITKGNVLLVTMAHGFITGNKFIKPITMIALLNNIDFYEQLAHMEYDDFFAACVLLRENGCTQEVVDAIK